MTAAGRSIAHLVIVISALRAIASAPQVPALPPKDTSLQTAGLRSSRTLTVHNLCNATVWPVLRDSKLAIMSSYRLRPGEHRLSVVPNGWAGTVGARTGCNSEGRHCETGDCSATTPCFNANVVPYTQAQFLFKSFGGLDLYTVIIDYANIPLLVEPAAATNGRYCQRGGCTADLREHCPAGGGVRGSAGQLLVCKSACEVYQDAAHCRDASHYSNATKRTCPTCSAFVNDFEALLACGGDPDYTVWTCRACYTNAKERTCLVYSAY